jgi:hypothetical protein
MTVVVAFLAGTTVGDILFAHRSEPTRTASNYVSDNFSFPIGPPLITRQINASRKSMGSRSDCPESDRLANSSANVATGQKQASSLVTSLMTSRTAGQ